MGKTLAIIKIYPEDPETQDNVKDALKTIQTGELQDIKEEPLAFGLNVFRIAVALPEKESGHMDKLEEELQAIKGVSNIEVEAVTLI